MTIFPDWPFELWARIFVWLGALSPFTWKKRAKEVESSRNSRTW